MMLKSEPLLKFIDCFPVNRVKGNLYKILSDLHEVVDFIVSIVHHGAIYPFKLSFMSSIDISNSVFC